MEEVKGEECKPSKPEQLGTETDEEGNELYEHRTFVVDPGQNPIRMDRWLTMVLRYKSRTQIQNATDAGCIWVNQKPKKKASYKIKPGDAISILFPHPPRPEMEPENLNLDIHYEDEHLLLLNKRPGMVVHQGVGNWDGTLLHGLLYHFNQHRLDADREEWDFPALVHRIDKDTSGLLIVPKNTYANSFLGKQFFDHSIDRIYNALVWGDLKENQGTITGNIARDKRDRKKYTVYQDPEIGKHAVTHYKVLDRFGFATLVQCQLETGRTHQIRVHMKHIGHTLFSDSFYGGDKILTHSQLPKYTDFMRNLQKTLPRQGLHARTLGFIHPDTEKKMHFEQPLPEDMQTTIDKMRAYRDTYL